MNRDNGAMSSAAPMVRPSLTRRALRELLYCLGSLPIGFGLIWILAGTLGFVALMAFLARAAGGSGPDVTEPAVGPAGVIFPIGLLIGLLVLVLLLPRLARGLGTIQRSLAARLLGETIPPPPPVRVSRSGGGPLTGLRWLTAGLRDGPGWRAMGYVAVKLPVAVLQGYAVFCGLFGLVNVSFPFWWRLFRNHPPGVSLDPVPVLTPLGVFRVETFIGTFAVFAGGVAMILVAPWLARATTVADRALMRGLLGPGRLAQRVRDLEETRAHAVDDAAAQLRRIERDLHDGAQVRLAALAMHLGRAKEKLGADGTTPDLDRARELVDVAHRNAKDALAELRDLARGIHPAILDNGLADALATLAAGSAIPVRLHCEIPVRPTPAIETIAYFCAGELLANAAKHSHANAITVTVASIVGESEAALRLRVTDDGVGGADPARGTGLAGLAQRVHTVDGQLEIASPPGGPTRVTVQLPLKV
jgi:signal transduction histidine kinase